MDKIFIKEFIGLIMISELKNELTISKDIKIKVKEMIYKIIIEEN